MEASKTGSVIPEYNVVQDVRASQKVFTASWPMTITPLDTYAQQLYAHIPQKRRNNLRWFMNRTSEAILQQKRSAVFNTSSTILGSAVPADAAGRPMFSPLPNMLNGWPIEITDSILNTETN